MEYSLKYFLCVRFFIYMQAGEDDAKMSLLIVTLVIMKVLTIMVMIVAMIMIFIVLPITKTKTEKKRLMSDNKVIKMMMIVAMMMVMMVFTVLPITAGTASMRVSMRTVAASSTRSRSSSSSSCKKKLLLLLLLLVMVVVVVVVVVVKKTLVELLNRVGLGWVEDLTLHQLDIVTKSLQEPWLHCISCKSLKYLIFEHPSP